VLRYGAFLFISVLAAFAATPTLAAFEPKVSDVCSTASSGPHRLILDRKMLLGQLLEKHAGISAIDLDKRGNGVGPDQQANALLDPRSFCKFCAEKVSDKLDQAHTDLVIFFQRHKKPIDPTKDSIDTRRISSGPEIRGFLLGQPGNDVAVCALAKSDKPSTPSSSDTAKPNQKTPIVADKLELPGYFSLRQNIDDLPIPQTDSSFKGLKQAKVSFVNDRIASKRSFSIDGAVGYTIGRTSFDEAGHFIGQFTPFFAYNQQTVRTDNPTKNTYAQNYSFGLMGDLTFPTGIAGGYQNIKVYPKYVISARNDAEVFSGNFVYTPMYGIPGIDNALYIVPEMLSFKFTPQLKVVLQDVVNAGRVPSLLSPGSYTWFGPKLDLTFFGEGILEGFSYYVSYEGYKIESGPLSRISYFQTGLGYDFGKTKLMSVVLTYQKGRNLDTLEKIDQLTLGLGLKY
jgi:hypothetical protein